MEDTNIRKYKLEEYLPIILIQGENKTKITTAEEIEDTRELRYFGNMLQEDFEEQALENISDEKIKKEIKRYQNIVKMLKQQYGCKCQLCGQTFLKDDGEFFCEAHHVIPLSENGSQNPDNVILLCANHHRMLHYAKDRIKIGELNNKKRIIYIDDVRYDVEF